MVHVDILKVDPSLPTPKYAHYGDAGMDIYSSEDCIINSGERKLISSGIKLAIPEGYEVQIRPRSGLALKNGITVLNTPGTIDHQYRGVVGVILINHGEAPFEVKKGERIAQMVFNRFESAELKEVSELSETARGEGGFGSTGK
jgi:dUTP pyrophosphatase